MMANPPDADAIRRRTTRMLKRALKTPASEAIIVGQTPEHALELADEVERMIEPTRTAVLQTFTRDGARHIDICREPPLGLLGLAFCGAAELEREYKGRRAAVFYDHYVSEYTP